MMLTDIHQHLIFGMDDGAQSFDETKEMLKEAVQNGITTVIATPHAAPGIEPFDLMKFYENVNAVKEWIKESGIGVQLFKGAELFYTDATVRMLNEGRIPSIAGGRKVLVEFPTMAEYDVLCSAARKLGGAGYSAVFAHVERYQCLRRLSNIEKLKDEYQVLMQVNAATILEPTGIFEKIWLKRALKADLIDIVASDAHNLGHRNNVLKQSYERILKEFGEEQAQRMYIANPRSLLPKARM